MDKRGWKYESNPREGKRHIFTKGGIILILSAGALALLRALMLSSWGPGELGFFDVVFMGIPNFVGRFFQYSIWGFRAPVHVVTIVTIYPLSAAMMVLPALYIASLQHYAKNKLLVAYIIAALILNVLASAGLYLFVMGA